MRITIAGQTEQRPWGYPVLRCERCAAVYHLSNSVRRDELARMNERAAAISKGWTVPEEGPVYCPDHSPDQP